MATMSNMFIWEVLLRLEELNILDDKRKEGAEKVRKYVWPSV